MADACSQLPAPWAELCREHGLVFAWAHDGAKAGGQWIEIKAGGVLETKWGSGTWSIARGIPQRLDFSFGASRHVCHLVDGGRFEVVQRLSLRTGKELKHPTARGEQVVTMGWPASAQPAARPLQRPAAPATPKKKRVGAAMWDDPGTPEKSRAPKRRCTATTSGSLGTLGKPPLRESEKKAAAGVAVEALFAGTWVISVDEAFWGKAYVGASSAFFSYCPPGSAREVRASFKIQGDGSSIAPFRIEDGYGMARLLSHTEDMRVWLLAHGGKSVWRRDEQAAWCDLLDEDAAASPMSRCLTRALAVLRPAAKGRLVGREREQADINSFLSDAVCAGGRSQVLYVSGMPGTGKTASVLEATARLRTAAENGSCPNFALVHVNGMCLSSPTGVFTEILQQINSQYRFLPRVPASDNRAHEELTKLFSGPRRGDETIVLLLDEIDALVTQGQSVLYQLFEWLSIPNVRLALVAIANTMDLPERLLPRIVSRLAVLRVNFAPYDRPQLRQILEDRLWLAKAEDAFSRDALELCAARVAAASGDARKALQVCRRAIEVQLSECSVNELSHVSLKHVAAAEESLLRVNAASQSIESLSMKARRLLLAIALEVKRSETLLVSLRDALRRYAIIMNTCERRESGDASAQSTSGILETSGHCEDAHFMVQRLEAMTLIRVHCTGPWSDETAGTSCMTQMEGHGQDVMLSLGESLDTDDVAEVLSGGPDNDLVGEMLGPHEDSRFRE